MADEDPFNALITRAPATGPPAGPGPLSGRTLVVKDLIDTAGLRTTYGSRLFAEHVPARSAPAVERLVGAGARVVGKANLDEFAWGVSGQNPWYGTVRNPAWPGRTAGGSSAGNGAALAAGMGELGLGTDTGCSVRLPSACCGTVGLKPRWGAVPADGVFPLVPSLDTVGPMARTVADVALMWSILTGRPVPAPGLAGRTIGLLTRAPSIGDAAVPVTCHDAESWIPALEGLGARVAAGRLPEPEANLWPVFFAEAAASHRDTFPARREEYGARCAAKLAAAQDVDADELAAAYRALERWRAHRPEADLFVSPSIGMSLPADDCDEAAIRVELSSFLRWVNFIGWAGLAIGNLHIAAPDDEAVLAAGLAWERAGLGVPAPRIDAPTPPS